MDWTSLGWPVLIVAIVLSQLLALYCVYLFVANLKPWHGKPIPCSRYLVVTAHPDDETMFFGPFIVDEIEQNSEVHLLCFSNGGFYGNGEKRGKELRKAAEKLGVLGSHVTLLDWPHFPDNPKIVWKASDVREVILDYCSGKPHIDAIVTFDSYGVSGHLNHIAIHNAVRTLREDGSFAPRIFLLESVSIFRKYCRPIDEIFSIIRPSPYRYRANQRQARRVQSAMQAHESQLTWFRELYRLVSRYMIVNTFVELGGRRRERTRSKRDGPRSGERSPREDSSSPSPPSRYESDSESGSSRRSPATPDKETNTTVGKNSPHEKKTQSKGAPAASGKHRQPSNKRVSSKAVPMPPGKTGFYPRSPDDQKNTSRRQEPRNTSGGITVPERKPLPKQPARSKGKFDRLSRSPPGKTACPISRPKFERSESKRKDRAGSSSGKRSAKKGDSSRGKN